MIVHLGKPPLFSIKVANHSLSNISHFKSLQ